MVSRIEHRIPTAKATPDVSDSLLVLSGPTETDITDGVVPEIVVEDVLAAMAGAFKTVDLPANRNGARSQVVLPSAMAHLGCVPECIPGAVNGDDRAGPEKV